MRFLAFLIIAWSLVVATAQAAYLLVPPDAQEILNVLGGDGNGLRIQAEALPDLFTLTARRLEEDPKIFIVEEPYLSGHWKGGKAVIEYARDLSYTQVSIYDKYGRRQRIYAVRSKLEVAKEEEEKRHEEALVLQAKNAFSGVPSDTDEEEDQPRRRHPVKPAPASTVEFEEVASEPEQKTTPPGVAPAVVKTPVVVETPVVVKAQPVVTPPPVKMAIVPPLPPPLPASPSRVPKVKSSVVVTPPAPPVVLDIDETSVEAGPHYEWDESRGTYIPVNVKVVAEATPTAAPKVVVTPVQKEVPVVAVVPKKAAPPQNFGPPIDLHPAPETTGEWTGLNADLDKQDKTLNVPLTPIPPSAPKTKAKAKTKKVHSDQSANNNQPPPEPVVAPITPVAAKQTNDVQPESDKVIHPAPVANAVPDESVPLMNVSASSPTESSAAPAALVTSVQVPAPAPPQNSPVAVLPPPVKKSKAKRKSSDVQAPPDQVILPSSDAHDLPADDKTGSAPVVKDSALAAATASLAHQPPAVTPVQIPGVTDTVASPGKQTLDSDNWVPSNAKPAPEEPIAVQERKKAAPQDSSIDGLMKLASINQGAVPDEANKWVPAPTALPMPDADIHDELNRARTEKKNTVARVAKINRDINNPEEGVLPVNSFEKSSGPRYGRHREYERRIFFAKKPNAPLPPKSYDFYVDETDRKKEFHNVYYYTHEDKGKPPRLVAVEKHSRVTFLSDYDVDKEDKGKVSNY